MSISKREKNILLLGGLVAAIFIATQLFPAVSGLYNERAERIEEIELRLEREQRLSEDSGMWRDRRIQAEMQLEELNEHVFSGDTVPIIEASIQGALTLHARNAGLSVGSTRLAERLETDGWIAVSQEMSFRTNSAGNTLEFLEKLENASPRLRVTDFSLNRNRNQFTGSITVVGFAKSDGVVQASSGNGQRRQG